MVVLCWQTTPPLTGHPTFEGGELELYGGFMLANHPTFEGGELKLYGGVVITHPSTKQQSEYFFVASPSIVGSGKP